MNGGGFLRGRTEDAGWGETASRGGRKGWTKGETRNDKFLVRSNASSSENGNVGMGKLMWKVKRDCNLERQKILRNPH